MTHWLAKHPDSLFATRTLAGHLLRGAAAAGLLAWAVMRQADHPLGAVLAAVLAVLALRGCPVCWAVGLVETLRHRRGG